MRNFTKAIITTTLTGLACATFGYGWYGTFDCRKWAGIEREAQRANMIQDVVIDRLKKKAEFFDGQPGLSNVDVAKLANDLGYKQTIDLTWQHQLDIIRGWRFENDYIRLTGLENPGNSQGHFLVKVDDALKYLNESSDGKK